MIACEVCGGFDAAVVHSDVFGSGASLIRCDTCGFKFYDKVVIPPDVFYNSWAYDAFVDTTYKHRSQSVWRRQNVSVEENSAFLRTYYTQLLRRGTGLLGRPAKTVYEVGCDYGACLDAARSMGLVSAGCELSHRAAGLAQGWGLDVVAGDFLEIEVPSGQDIFVLLDVLEHLQRPRAALERVSNHIANDGIIIIKTFYDEFHETILLEIDKPIAIRELHRQGYFSPAAHPSHFDRPVLRALLNKTGFMILEETVDEACGQVTIFARLA